VPIGCDLQNVTHSTIEGTLAENRAAYAIEVSGVEGLNFTGRYIAVDADYDPVDYVAFNSESCDVSRYVSQKYVAADVLAIGGMLQKLSAGNETLEVTIWRGAVGTGTLVDSASTASPHGAVLVTAIQEGQGLPGIPMPEMIIQY
jgi:hypothetical protein